MNLFDVKLTIMNKKRKLPLSLNILAEDNESAILKAKKTIPKKLLDRVVNMRADLVLGENNIQLGEVTEI